MNLKKVFIRFYKSFNDDFIRKNKGVEPKPWEIIDGSFYPYIEVSIDSRITTIVGANESGKSHLLSAIEKAITGEGIQRSDFCRYSRFFTVKQNELKYPDFGLEWGVSLSEQEKLREIIPEIYPDIRFDRFLLFRENINKLTVYIPDERKYKNYSLHDEQVTRLQDLLPHLFEIKSNVALPSSVPIKKLVELGQSNYSDSNKFELLDPKQRSKIVSAIDVFSDNSEELITQVRSYGGKTEEIGSEAVEAMKSIILAIKENDSDDKKDAREKQFNLAYKLICEIAQVDTNALIDLAKAIKDDEQGYANGILEKINRQLATNFNFPNFWAQDRKFGLKVMARDYDLVFTISDRTGTEYSFDERSQGLRYFLSYYIEYRAHKPHPSKNEILLMDEPDAYLSSQAQQDLLKIFNLFASHEPDSHLTKPIQVIYVTHSPFLIDKNYTERIRVLQKGNEDEGTRVVKDFAQNRYEPLRSSIGPHIGESVFIGNCNLMVEGIGDQIIIAGAARYLRNLGISEVENLDLNQITIVDSGGAPQVPYMVYLACGRHVDKMAVIVLLDSDSSGDKAKDRLLGKNRKGRDGKPLLQSQYILQLGDLKKEFTLRGSGSFTELEIEDLVPLPICIEATKLYLKEFLLVDDTNLKPFAEELFAAESMEQTILDSIQTILAKYPEQDLEIGKPGFARNVIQVITNWSKQPQLLDEKQADALRQFEGNFRALFKQLKAMQRRAQQRLTDEKLSEKIERLKKEFVANYPSAKGEHAVMLFDDIETILDTNKEDNSSKEIEATRETIQSLRRIHKLDELNKWIDDYPKFKEDLNQVKYAGLVASQEDSDENLELEKTLEEVPALQSEAERVNNREVAVTSKEETVKVADGFPKANTERKRSQTNKDTT